MKITKVKEIRKAVLPFDGPSLLTHGILYDGQHAEKNTLNYVKQRVETANKNTRSMYSIFKKRSMESEDKSVIDLHNSTVEAVKALLLYKK